ASACCSKHAREVSPETAAAFLPFSHRSHPTSTKLDAQLGQTRVRVGRRDRVPPLAALLLLDAAGLHELRPLLFILVDEFGIVFRRAGRDFSAVIAQLLLHLVGGE